MIIKVRNEMFKLKVKILEFYTQNRARYPIYDETMQSRSLLECKTTELKQFFKSIILTPKIANKSIAFLFVLSIYTAQQKLSIDFIIASNFRRIRNDLFEVINKYGDP